MASTVRSPTPTISSGSAYSFQAFFDLFLGSKRLSEEGRDRMLLDLFYISLLKLIDT